MDFWKTSGTLTADYRYHSVGIYIIIVSYANVLRGVSV